MPLFRTFPAPCPAFTLGACLLLALAAPAGAARRTQQAAPVLEGTLAGEFALQAGQLDEASRWYLDAARATDDAGPGRTRHAHRAARQRRQARADAALALWRQRAPDSLAMHAAQATLALRRNDAAQARTRARRAAGRPRRHRLAPCAAGAEQRRQGSEARRPPAGRAGRRPRSPIACKRGSPSAAWRSGSNNRRWPTGSSMKSCEALPGRAARRAAARQPVARIGQAGCAQGARDHRRDRVPERRDAHVDRRRIRRAGRQRWPPRACSRAGRRTIAATACARRCCARRRPGRTRRSCTTNCRRIR
jgi:hypothetical protein